MTISSKIFREALLTIGLTCVIFAVALSLIYLGLPSAYVIGSMMVLAFFSLVAMGVDLYRRSQKGIRVVLSNGKKGKWLKRYRKIKAPSPLKAIEKLTGKKLKRK